MTYGPYFSYASDRARHISFPLGGIGAGCIGLSGAGRLIDWEIENRPDKGNGNGFSNFCIKAEKGGHLLDARILHGPFLGSLAGDRGAGETREFGYGVRREYLTGLPHFRESRFEGFYPTAELSFSDSSFPGAVQMLAFSPFIPLDDRASSMPIAMFEFRVDNPTLEAIDYTVIGSLGNPVKGPHASRLAKTSALTGMTSFSAEPERNSPEFGQVIVATDGDETSWQHEWYRGSWFDSLEVFWRDITTVGPLKDRVYKDTYFNRRPDGRYRYRGHSSLATKKTIAPGSHDTFRFAIAWYFPIFEKDWINIFGYVEEPREHSRRWRNYYGVLWQDVESIAEEAFSNWDSLKARTLNFRDALRGSTLPAAVLDAVSANMSILKSPTVLRLENGELYGFEGTDATAGSCEGSCTHVWNYQQTVPYLFPALERSMREVDFKYNQDPASGGMAFRLCLPLGVGRYDVRPCADGQFGNVLKAYRDWKLSGDIEWLKSVWSSIKRAIEFAWSPLNHDRWDPNKTGVLWGPQHHTLDMELFGPNSWLSGFYLGALRAGAIMARRLGDDSTADEYEKIFERGKAWVDQHLFNGRYYHQLVDLADLAQLKPFEDGPVNPVLVGSIQDIYWSSEHRELKYQIGEGCLIDQVLAQWHANLYGLGDLFDPQKVEIALQSIYRLNFKKRIGDLANPCRVFAAEDESGTIVCEWPSDTRRPAIPAPYSQETFHGCEYAFGSMLIQAGQVEKGIEVFAAVRDRYRGGNRNPWNEMECGSNYARSMASYAGLLALSGFTFDATKSLIGFSPRLQSSGRFNSFWCAGTGWGTALLEDGIIEIRTLEGKLTVERLRILDRQLSNPVVCINGSAIATPTFENDELVLTHSVTMGESDILTVRSSDIKVSDLTCIVDASPNS